MEAEFQRFYLLLLQGVILLIVGWVGVSVRGVYRELRTLNGRLRTLEERQRGHENLDDSRFKDLQELIREVISSLRESRGARE